MINLFILINFEKIINKNLFIYFFQVKSNQPNKNKNIYRAKMKFNLQKNK